MGLFDRFRKKDNFLDNPPDFSTPPGSEKSAGVPGSDPLLNDPLGIDQEVAARDPLAGASTFNHDIFSDNQGGQSARDYARSLGQQTAGGVQQGATVRGAITGHEADLILERLDTIKAELDAIKQRMMRVERFMEQAEQKAGQRRYF